MNFEELIRARQSCREFSDREVPQEDILACLGAARLSPSACNAQPYHITVCTGSVARETAACLQSAGINKFTSNVPCFFVISEAPYNIADAGASLLKDQDFRGIDIGIAVAQLTLCAVDRGLATCILGWFDEKKLQNLLGIKNRIRVVVALGCAADGYALRPKVRKELDELSDIR